MRSIVRNTTTGPPWSEKDGPHPHSGRTLGTPPIIVGHVGTREWVATAVAASAASVLRQR